MPALKRQSEYQTAAISVSASGDNTLITGVANQTIRVWKVMLTLAAGTITFKDGASTSLSGAMTLTALVLEPNGDSNPNPLFVTTAGNNFVANLSGANQLSGTIWYQQS